MSNHHFHRSAGLFTILLFYYFISIRFQAEVFARVAKPECRTTIFTGRPDRLPFYCFISIRFQAEVFASRVAEPECRTTIFTGRPDRLLFYCFAILFPFGSRQRFLLGFRNLNVEPPFSPVGRTIYHFTILLFHFHSVPGRGFCSGREP